MIIGSNDFVLFEFRISTLYVTIKKSTCIREEFDFTKKTISNMYDSVLKMDNKKINILYDFRNLGLTQIGLFQEWANLFMERLEDSKKCIHKAIIVTNSDIMINILNTFLNSKANFLYLVTKSMDEANNFIKLSNYLNN